MYKPQEVEQEILRFWKKKKIYKKVKNKNKKGKKFYMMDGPPYATGHIHMGTALNKILKDVAMRSQRLQGKDVFDRAGYDTHGLPIEFQVEKEIGAKTKKDVEKFGIKKFIEKCKKFATKFIDVMNAEFENLGVWMDFENPYLTLNKKYIETIWDTFKVADKKELLYLGKYPVHICPRCETAVAYNEIEYKEQEDMSVFVKFPIEDKKNNFLIIWTTTPWTLPGNTGVMVHPNFNYREIEILNGDFSGEKWILAKELVDKIMQELNLKYNVLKEYRGKDLNGLRYENPLSKNLNLDLNLDKAYKVVLSSRYVNLEEGTGLVHSAPGHGKEDFEVGQKAGLEMPSPVDISGAMTEEAGKYAGKKARIVDEEIIKDLEKQNMLVYKKKYSHDYPFCWRCKSALLMVAQPQWFLKISKIHKKLLQENEKTNWIPPWMQLRMNAWLEGISDWPVSRKRYWGTPLPIWICENEECKEKIVVGSVEELEKLSIRSGAKRKKIKEIHKPEIDSIVLKCKKCNGKMKRVPEVLDVWFDSGVSSWAALDTQEKIKKYWPADLNLEGRDQVRGWWNSQLILSMIKHNKKPFENILVHGMVLDLGKVKMSKSLGNFIAPVDVIKKYSRDYLRYYFAKESKGDDFAFDESEFKEIHKIFRVLLNVNNFVNQLEKKKTSESVEDKWILSKFNYLIKQVKDNYNKFEFPQATKLFEKFLVDELSRTYIQLTRERADETYEVLNKIRKELLILCAPICPFITEYIWQSLREKKIVKKESVHLCDWPQVKEKKINKKLEEKFQFILEIIEKGLAERNEKSIGLKWPLAKAVISTDKDISKELREIIARQLNIKKIEIKKIKKADIEIKLDTEITPELELEGFSREIARKIQSARKKAGLVKKDKINLIIVSDLNLEKHKQFLKQRTNASKILITKKIDNKTEKKYKNKSEEKIKNKKIKILFNKI